MSLLCPSCKVDLVMSDRQGIEIDYCPKCRGVWLDRGELDKILERAAGPSHAPPQAAPPMVAPGAANASLFGRAPAQAAQPPPAPQRDAPYPQDGYRDDRRRYRHDDDDDDDRRKYGQGYKRKSWLSDIFD